MDWILGASTEMLNIVLTNEAGVRIQLPDSGEISASIYTPGSTDCTYVAGTNPNNNPEANAVVRPGQQVNVNLDCSGFSGNSGDYYRANVTIQYTNMGSTMVHNSVGEIFGPIE
ncbi:hypothetical protein ACFLRC_04955 [Candidatus Altiarchaeota archaeon]